MGSRKNFEKLSFSELLDLCSDSKSPFHNDAWREFIRRYKNLIYDNVVKRCRAWNHTRLHRQMQEAADDIVTDIFLNLCKDDFQAIRNFRGRHKKKQFFAWLKAISIHAANNYNKKYFIRYLADMDIIDEGELSLGADYLSKLDFNTGWSLYEAIVDQLRHSPKTQRKNLERDIHIFMLYVWMDFPKEMIAAIPCLRDIGHRVTDLVVNRLRTTLRNSL